MAMLMIDGYGELSEARKVVKPRICDECTTAVLAENEDKKCGRCVTRLAERREHAEATERLQFRLAVIFLLMLAVSAFGIRYMILATKDHGVNGVGFQRSGNATQQR